MKKNGIIILVFSIFAVSACTYQNNNRIEQKDINLGNERIYGVSPDSAARQLKNVYTPNPENDKRAAALREKLFGKAAAAETGV